jgi:hypothetical protein
MSPSLDAILKEQHPFAIKCIFLVGNAHPTPNDEN